MSTNTRAEYFPTDDQNFSPPAGQGRHQNGNGHSHNGHEKIFELKRSADPDTIAVLEARRVCRADKRLNTSEKSCFDEIADRALNPQWWECKGVVVVADSILASLFGVTERTIWSWKYHLEETGYLWITKRIKDNMWPLTSYHLSCLHKRRVQKTDADGTYGKGEGRSAPSSDLAAIGRAKRNAKLIERRAQKLLALTGGLAALPVTPAGSPTAPAPVENAEMPAISALDRNSFRPPAEKDFGPEPKKISAQSRNEFRPGAEKDFGPEPKKISAQSRSELRPPAEADFGHIEAESKVKIPKEGILPASNRLGTRAMGALGRRKPSPEEEDFIELCLAVLGKAEMKANGGLWRTLYRDKPAKARRCILETKETKANRPATLEKTWGAFAMDLWKNNRVGA